MRLDLIQPGGPTSQTLRRLYQPINNISTWVQEDMINASNYNSVQVNYTKRYTHGLTSLINYTYSKSLDYGGSAASGGGSAGNPQTVTNLKAGYGASGFDQKHRLVSSTTYELPFGTGKKFLNSGFVSKLAGGFEIDAITTYDSGPPFSVSLNSGVNSGSPSWPNRIASRGKIDHGNPVRFFNATLCPLGDDIVGQWCAVCFPDTTRKYLWQRRAFGTVRAHDEGLGHRRTTAVQAIRRQEPEPEI